MKLKVGTEFNSIVEVMDNVFGWNYKACMKGWYRLSEYPKTSAWFPKIAVLEHGRPQPGDKWYGWCNTISDDSKYIYMNNFEDPSRLNKEDDCEDAHVTFIKYQKGKYQYAGVYNRVRLDKQKGWIFEKIADDIDVEDYL